MTKKFGSASAFKNALEARLRQRGQEQGIPFSTLQLKFVLERLLARLFQIDPPPWMLKGGFAMDLRFRPRARTTKDIDLSVPFVGETRGAMSAALRDRLQEAVDVDCGDFLTFRIGEPKRELTNAPQGGARYPCEAVFIGKTYAKFHIDIGVGDATADEPEQLTGDDLLDFAGIPPAVVLAIPKPQQFAEKAHAYTFPWLNRTNTRTKDLADLVLLIEQGLLDLGIVRSALRMTFEIRNTHPLPKTLAAPPPSWEADFAGMAAECNLSTTDYLVAFAILDRFWSDNSLGEDPS